MLVLSRKVGEHVCIGDDVRITVVSTGSNKVRIGIEAPDDVRVDRDEVRASKEKSKASGDE
jgi:carbon storage regulator